MFKLAERSSRKPDAPALAWPAGTLSHGELLAMSHGAAAQLDRLGIAAGERVAVWGRKSPETIALVLGCLLSGRPALLPPADLRAGTLRELLERAGADHLLATEPLDGATVVDPAAGPVAAGADTAHDPGPDDLALMLTTSGSTGVPKVVPLSHGAIERFSNWAADQFGIGAGTRVLSYCGLNFDLSLLEVWTTLGHGGCAVLVAQERSTQPDHLFDLIDAHDVNVVQGIPMLYRLLLDAAAPGRALPGVRHAILTGDTAAPRLLERLPALFENARIYNVYGCTETNDSFIHSIDVGRALELGAIPLGQPVPGVSALMVRDGRIVHRGSGELWVSTPFQTSGYLGERSRRDAFVADPLGRPDRTYFRTGDLVRRDAAGRVFLEGRDDLHVKVRGNRVNLLAVEQALLEDPHVSEAAVVAFDDEVAGKRLHAVVRGRRGGEVNTLRLRTQCARRLTRVAIPSTIEVQDEPLPRTTTGKVDRRAVKLGAGAEAHE